LSPGNNVLILANDNTAGIPYNIKLALEKYTGYDCRLITCKRTYLDLPRDELASDMTYNQFMSALRWADIVHLNESVVSGQFPAERNIFFKDTNKKVNLYKVLGDRKKKFRHAHGSYIRKFGEQVNVICRRHNIQQIVTSPDLLSIARDAVWLPQILPLDRCQLLEYNPAPVGPGDRLSISHSPTNRAVKGSDEFEAELARVKDMNYVKIENMSHTDCLKARRGCHIHFDQSRLQVYGVSALEGLAMGQVVLVGMGIGSRYQPGHPFIDVNRLGMRKALKTAVHVATHPHERMSFLATARDWVEENNHPRVIANKLRSIYESAEN